MKAKIDREGGEEEELGGRRRRRDRMRRDVTRWVRRDWGKEIEGRGEREEGR